ncbi:MAG TPA: hypothetical protein VGE29_17155 [Prosthecobacter sp.]
MSPLPALVPMLPVLIPAVLVTVGWMVVLARRSGMHRRMALLAASLAVFFLSITIGLARYRQFGLNIRLSHDLVVMGQLAERLTNAVLIIKLGAVALVVHLLLAAWALTQACNDRNGRSAP